MSKFQADPEKVNEIINDVWKNFDFGKVRKIMHKLDWEWVFGIPSVEVMKDKVAYLIRQAFLFESFDIITEDTRSWISAGGFEVSVYTDYSYEVKCILEEWGNIW